jgi:hypothetical protein
MKKVLPFIIIGLLFSCTKNGPANSSALSFEINGLKRSGYISTNFQFNYANGVLIAYQVNFLTTGASIYVNQTTINNDSILLNSTYGTSQNSLRPEIVFSDNQTLTSTQITIPPGAIGYTSSNAFNFVITQRSSTTISGTFSGIISGTNSANGNKVTDTISNGIFTNIPIVRVFQ